MTDPKSPRPEKLGELRRRLDGIDTEIIDLVAERQSVVAAIGAYWVVERSLGLA